MNNKKIRKILAQSLMLILSLTQNSLAVSQTKPKYTTHFVVDADVKTSENDKKPFYKGRGVKIAAASVIGLVTLGAGSTLVYKNYQSKIEDAKKQAENKVKDEKFINSLKSAIETGDLGSKESEYSAKVYETLYPDYTVKLEKEISKEFIKDPHTADGLNAVEFFEKFKTSHSEIFENTKDDFAVFFSALVLLSQKSKIGFTKLSPMNNEADKQTMERSLAEKQREEAKEFLDKSKKNREESEKIIQEIEEIEKQREEAKKRSEENRSLFLIYEGARIWKKVTISWKEKIAEIEAYIKIVEAEDEKTKAEEDLKFIKDRVESAEKKLKEMRVKEIYDEIEENKSCICKYADDDFFEQYNKKLKEVDESLKEPYEKVKEAKKAEEDIQNHAYFILREGRQICGGVDHSWGERIKELEVFKKRAGKNDRYEEIMEFVEKSVEFAKKKLEEIKAKEIWDKLQKNIRCINEYVSSAFLEPYEKTLKEVLEVLREAYERVKEARRIVNEKMHDRIIKEQEMLEEEKIKIEEHEEFIEIKKEALKNRKNNLKC